MSAALKQHPLSAAFPDMTTERFEAIRDGVYPADESILQALLASDWFKSLGASQRAIYGAIWFHHLEVGSNQYVRRIKTNTPRYAAERALRCIQEEARA